MVAKLFGGSLRDARLFPCVAFKVPREGRPSANLLLAGRKTGQADENFFASCVATALTEKAAGAIKPVLDAFRRYSRYPTHLGLSDFAAADRAGHAAGAPRFPWCLVFKPTALAREQGASAPFFLQQLSAHERRLMSSSPCARGPRIGSNDSVAFTGDGGAFAFSRLRSHAISWHLLSSTG